VIFRWDPAKAIINLEKHGVSFAEAATAFDDPLSATFPDAEHSRGEHRYLTIGMSIAFRVLVVAHTDDGREVRIISARPATRKEREYHEEG
jgi:uncharacterized DUF497 family protein